MEVNGIFQKHSQKSKLCTAGRRVQGKARGVVAVSCFFGRGGEGGLNCLKTEPFISWDIISLKGKTFFLWH